MPTPNITEDASTPAAPFTGTGNGPISSTAITPPAGALVVAIAAGGWNSSKTAASGIAISDSVGLEWQQLAYAQGSDTDSRGAAGIWCAYIDAAPGPVTVTASFTALSGGRMLALKVLNGADPNQSAATGWTVINTGAQSVSAGEIAVNLTVVGSVVYGISDDAYWHDTFTAEGGTTVLGTSYADATDGVTLTSWRSTNPTSVIGPASFGGTYNEAANCNVVAFEVMPLGYGSGGGAATIPAVPTFTDGEVVPASKLNALVANVANLYTVINGGQRYQPYTPGGKGPIKPFTCLSVTNPAFVLPDSTETLVPWDTVLANSDASWSPLDANLIRINTPGFWRMHFQASVLTSDVAEMAVALLVNGTSVGTSGVATSQTYGTACGVSVTMELPTDTLIYTWVIQANGSAATCNIGLMQFVAEWLGS